MFRIQKEKKSIFNLDQKHWQGHLKIHQLVTDQRDIISHMDCCQKWMDSIDQSGTIKPSVDSSPPSAWMLFGDHGSYVNN